MRRSALPRLLAAALLLVVPAAVRSQITVHTDLASFLAATSNAGTDSFDDLATGSAATSVARSAGRFGYVASANTTGLYVTGPGADRWLSTNTSTDVVTFGGFGPTVRGIGGFFFGTDLDGLFRAGTTLTLRATDASGTTTHALVGATTGSFLGFVSTGAMSSLTVETVLPPADLAWPTVNGLVVAEATVSAVPEPSMVVVLGTGLVGVALVGWRRRAGW